MTANNGGISIDKLKAIPYFDASVWTPGRGIFSLCFYVKGNWECWLPAGENVIKINTTPVEAEYFGDAPERASDKLFNLFDLAAQRTSSAEMYLPMRGIANDFHNLATSLAKLDVFFELSKKPKTETARFVVTEIEFIIGVCRSVFDLLQEIIGELWMKIKLKDTSIRKRLLPASFREVILKSNKHQSGAEISARFGLPTSIAEWYVSQADFFMHLRSLRDSIAHRGSDAVQTLFVTDRGFAVHREQKPWSNFHSWPHEVELPNELVPIRPAVCTIIRNTINATESFADVLESTIKLSKPLFPGFKFYFRGYHTQKLIQLDEIVSSSLWCDSQTSTATSFQGQA